MTTIVTIKMQKLVIELLDRVHGGENFHNVMLEEKFELIQHLIEFEVEDICFEQSGVTTGEYVVIVDCNKIELGRGEL